MQKRMRTFGISGLGVMLALALGGCQLLGNDKASDAGATSPTLPPATETPAPTPNNAGQPPKKTTVVATSSLTRPTDPEARVKAISKGRPNPFSPLVPAGSGKAAPEGKATAASNSSTPGNPEKTPGSTALPKELILPSSGASSGASSALPQVKPGVSPIPSGQVVLPPLPQATLAKQVKVQGVALVGGTPKAILQAPNEAVVRTVSEGDFLSNGQIRVASIQLNGQEPKVVLQESGQLVSVGVGAPSAPASPSPSP
jgi:hypothetical protein